MIVAGHTKNVPVMKMGL